MILVERTIEANRATVWDVVSRVDRWSEWLDTFEDVTRIERIGYPDAVGTRFRVRQPGLAAAEYEVTDWRPEAGFTWVADVKSVRTTASHSLLATGNATRLRLSVEWSGRGAWFVRLLFSGKTRRYLHQEAAEFARMAEERHGETRRTG